MKKPKLEMRGILPRYPEDHTLFLVTKLAEIEPCTIAELVRHLGGEPREGNAPSSDYNLVQQALKQAQKEGKVDIGVKRGSWRVVADKK
jgi:hypothetical protein